MKVNLEVCTCKPAGVPLKELLHSVVLPGAGKELLPIFPQPPIHHCLDLITAVMR